MMRPRHSWLLLMVTCVTLGAAGGAAGAPDASAGDGVAFFEKEVRPLIEANCLKCHGGEEKIKGGLRITSRDELLKGGDLGPVINPDGANAHQSLLLRAISYKDDKLQMPPKGKLPPEAIATLTKWVEMGAPFPGALAGA